MRTEELTQLEQRLVAVVNAGEVLDLAGDHPVTFEAMNGWRPERHIRAEVIRDVLLARHDTGTQVDGPCRPVRALRI